MSSRHNCEGTWRPKKSIYDDLDIGESSNLNEMTTSRRMATQNVMTKTTKRSLSNASSTSTETDRNEHIFDTFPRRSRLRNTDTFFEKFEEKMDEMVSGFRTGISLQEPDDFFTRPRLSARKSRDDFFGRPRLMDDEFFSPMFDREPRHVRPIKHDAEYADSGVFSVGKGSGSRRNTSGSINTVQDEIPDPERFEVEVDVKGFEPEELIVKTEGLTLIVSAAKENPEDPDASFSELIQEIEIPEGVNPYDVVSNLMPNGVLKIEAPSRTDICPDVG